MTNRIGSPIHDPHAHIDGEPDPWADIPDVIKGSKLVTIEQGLGSVSLQSAPAPMANALNPELAPPSLDTLAPPISEAVLVDPITELTEGIKSGQYGAELDESDKNALLATLAKIQPARYHQ